MSSPLPVVTSMGWGGVWLPPLIVSIGLLAVGVYYAYGRHTGRIAPGNRRRDGSLLVPQLAIDGFYWMIDGLAERLHTLGVRPNHVTVASLILSLLAGVALSFGVFGWGAVAFAFAASGDALDGLIARKSGAGSRAGAFLDSALDRLAEAAVLGGLAVWGAGGLMTWLAFWTLVASFTISYLRARGHSLGYDCPEGLMQRPERLALLLVSLVIAVPVASLVEPGALYPEFHAVLAALGLIGVLSTWTAVDRGRRIYLELRRPESV